METITMKQSTSLITLLLFVANILFGQEQKIKVSDKLELIKLSPETCIHIRE